ncbi:BolA family protein [Pseudorhodoferax aquiterrae]|uniref:BolA family protein n=1 Tax=Pseudorhodoferax aquiterrae TaxID=747304 RepID=UPI0016743797|nr:BolA family protein [Pseudorhodoferax aquiterrae]
MTVTAAEMAQALRAALAPTQLEVLDESAAHAGHAGAGPQPWGTHFRVRIASPKFAGLSRVAQHRLVYDPLRQMITQGVHAIAIDILPSVHPAATPSPSQALPSQNP